MSNYFQPYQFGSSYQSGAPLASEDHAFPLMPQRPSQHSGNSNPMQFQTSLPGLPTLPKPLDLPQGADRQEGSFNTFPGPNAFLSHTHTNRSTTYDAQVPPAFNNLPNYPAHPSVDMYHPSQPILNPMSAKPHDTVMRDSTPRQRTPNDTDMKSTFGSRSRNGDQELEDGEVNTRTVSEPDRLHVRPNNPQTSLNAIPGYEHRIWSSQQESKRLIQQLTAWGLDIQEILAEVTESKALESLGREMGFQFGTEARASTKAQNTFPSNATSHVTPSSTPQILPTANGAVESQNAHVPTAKRIAKPNNHQDPNKDNNDVTVAQAVKPMDRKALIAQKLAARNVRPSPSPSSGMPPKQSSRRVIEQSLLTKAVQMDSNDLEKESERAPPMRPPEQTQQDVEATRKFQTDLARQRMAALKQKALVKQNQPLDPARQRSEHSEPPVLKESPNRTGDLSINAIEPPKISNPRSPTRKESYFSPVSQSPMFNIPGLFSMPETAAESRVSEPANGQSVETLILTQEGPSTTTVSSEPLGREETDAEVMMPSDFASGHQPQNPRKRRRADEFFDSPPNRSKKSLMRADEDVVIDISDDENSLSNDSHVLGSANGPDTIGNSFTNHTESPRQSAAEGSNSPLNAVAQGGLPTAPHSEGTPSGSLLAKTAESNGLKTKEMEIESMNRKIAELEANIRARKAKQAASRTQSPGDKSLFIPAEVMAETIEAVSDAMDQGLDFRENEPNADESKVEGDSAAESLDILDDPVLSVPNGISVQPNPSRDPLSSPQPPDVHTQPDKDLILDKLNTSVPDLDSGKSTPPEFGINDQDVDVRIERHRIDASLPRSKMHQRRASRRLEIQAGLPVLDQEIEKRRKQLESIRAQEVEMQADIQRGVEGRQMLLDELSRLSDVLDSMDWKTDRASPQKTEDEIQRRSAEVDHSGSYKDVSLRTDSAQRDGHGDMQAVEDYTQSRIENQPLSNVSRVSQLEPESGLPNTAGATSFDENDESLDEELDGDNMDISRSSLDEGEIEESIINASLSQSGKGSERSDHEQSLNGSISGKDPFSVKAGYAGPDDSTTVRQEDHSRPDVTGDLDEGIGRGDESDSSPFSEELEMYEPPDEPPRDPSALAPRPPAGFSGIDQHSPDAQEYESGGSPNINKHRANVQADPRNATDAMIEDTHIKANSEGSDDDYEPAEPSAEEMDFRERSPQSTTEQVIIPPSSADANTRDVRRKVFSHHYDSH